MSVIVLAALAVGIIAGTAVAVVVRGFSRQVRAELDAVKAYHPSRRPLASFDEDAGQALTVVAKDPNPNDPVTMPKQHAANCKCSRCQTSSEHIPAASELGERLASPAELWAQLSTDQQIALALDQLMDRPAPASLVERVTR